MCALERGLRIAHFEILGELGAGGMGVVYRARDQILHREVALKIVHPDRSSDDFRHRILQEARIAATLTHPNIAAVFEAGESEGAAGEPTQIYVAQELVDGETLASRIARAPLPLAEATEIVLQLLDALSEAHARGIVHRDIKPANLMIAATGRLKVLDFGIAKRLVSPADTTRLSGDPALPSTPAEGGTIIGTPSYMAPEQLRGIADARTDLFATGCVLYELLTAQRLFHLPSHAGDWPSSAPPAQALRRLRPDVPAAVASVIERAVAVDPQDRFRDAASFAAALGQAAGAPAARRMGSVRAGAAARRMRLPMAAAALLVVFLVALGLWRWSKPALAFAERDWVLVASVLNETGEAVFDSALEGALETDLRQSRYVNVFDQGQVANALSMMRLPPSTRIDLETGRNVCRLAGIRVLLIPKILSIGGAYQLEASLVEPASGRVVDQLRVTARGREDVLIRGIDEFSRAVRRRLGESLAAIEKTSPSIVEYATPSWEALRYARLGGEALAESDTPRAARAFEQALEHDPQFPAALVSLGLLYVEFLNRREEGLRLITLGYEHSSNTSEREHLMVRALHRQFVTNDLAGALEDYRFVSSLYPDMFQPSNNSGRILRQLGRDSDAVAMFERAHALDPRHAGPLWNLWELHLNQLDDPLRAETYVRMLAELQPDNAWIRHIVAWTDVALRRYERAEEGTREVLSSVPLHPFAMPNLGHLLLRRGAAAEAADVYRDLLEKARSRALNVSTSDAAVFLGIALTDAGRGAEAREVYESEIARLNRPPGSAPDLVADARLAMLNAAAGHRRRAESLAASVVARQPANPWILYTAARTRALLGDEDGAADLLRKARAARYDQPYFVLVDPAFRTMQDHPVVEEIAVR
jgi:tetratricopeptide (TPR) repeat protein/predicted Ser/Thr protein kinase